MTNARVVATALMVFICTPAKGASWGYPDDEPSEAMRVDHVAVAPYSDVEAIKTDVGLCGDYVYRKRRLNPIIEVGGQ